MPHGTVGIAFIQLGIGVILLATLPVWKLHQQADEENAKSMGIMDALKIKGVPSLLMGFFAYCAAEATAMNWASTYLVEVKEITTEQAARFASLFYIGMTVGRFLGGFIMNKLGDRKMIILGTCILSCGIISLLIPVENPTVSLIGFIVIGLGCAPIYPCIIHSTPGNFGAENSGAIIGIQMASAYVGSTFMPPLFGLLGNAISFRIMPFYLLAFMLLMICMIEHMFKMTSRKAEASE
ncbi:MAG: MFS transporter [Muribaculaceae bacterium]|nr:MFS transporter [Muribaculaceae bacterium]